MKIIAVAGEPGTGKSTLMRAVFPHEGFAFRYGTVRGEMFGDVARLGIYRPGAKFPGTDQLSMAVQPDLLRFVAEQRGKATPRVVLWEGDRLSNTSILSHARVHGIEVTVVVLETAPRIVERRRVERGDTFTDAWLRSRKTKVANFVKAARSLATVWTLPSNSQADLVLNAEKLSSLIFDH